MGKLLSSYQSYNSDFENWRFLPFIDRIETLGPVITGMANTIGGKISIGMDFTNVHLTGSNIDEMMIRDTLETFCLPKM